MALRTSEGTPSTSYTSPPKYEHDVFVSFRGEDTRNSFTSHLYQAMSDKGIKAFKDDAALERGTEISAGLLQAIESARIAVIVFSKNYASSRWCLDELVHILNCRKKSGQSILPVFYNVDPSEVRKQTGKFGLALAEHERNFKDKNIDKIRRWREALTEVADIAGLTFKDGESESEFIQNITKEILKVKSKGTHLFVSRYPVGIDSRAKYVEVLLDPRRNNVKMVGLYGVGGVGKTTIAKAVYNKIVDDFDVSFFLENVHEMSSTYDGIIQLQNKLLSKSLRDSCSNVNSVPKGITMIKDELCRKKLLLVLDDVDDQKEIVNLLGDCDWFGAGSRIIITTRDKHLLNALEIPAVYKVEELDQHEARKLFCWHAFRRSEPNADYLQLSKQFINYAKGLPLALEVLGSQLRGRNYSDWQCQLQQYEVIPTEGIQKILKKSFDRLEQIEKDVFLDIACFFKGWDKAYVMNMLEACGKYPSSVIPNLIDKCLITDEFGKLSMHDLVQQMGREIVRLQSPEYPGQRSRLWYYKDALDVLNENTGTDKIRGLMLCWPEPEPRVMHLDAKTFKKMKSLKFLIVRNVHIRGLEYLPNGLRLLDWPDYSSPLPSAFRPQSLVELNMPHSCITLEEPFWQGIRLENLKHIKCGSCESIMEFPALCTPNLEELDLSKCKNLIVVDELVGSLDKLKIWILEGCEKLQTLPGSLMLRSLRYFDLRDCLMLEKFPNILPGMESLQTLLLSRTGIKGLPSSIEYLTRLEKLDLSYCQSLMDLPDSIYKLQHLSVLEISHCTKLKIDRRLTYHSFGSKYGFLKLEYLNLNNCENLTELDLLMMPDYFPELKYLYLDGSNICMIPESISRFARLRILGIKNCKQLQKIPRLSQSIRTVCAMNCKSLNSESLSCILSQAREILGISPDKICQGARSDISVDPQSSHRLSHQSVLSSLLFDEFASEAKRSISEDEDIDCKFILPIIDIPKWFNHQRVENSISFWVGPRFPKFAFCIAFGPEAQRCGFFCQVYLKINGCKKKSINVFSHEEVVSDHLWLFSKSHRELQKQLNDSNPSKRNFVEVVCNVYSPDGGESLPAFIKGCGVHVKCTCHPQTFDFFNANNDNVDDDLRQEQRCAVWNILNVSKREDMPPNDLEMQHHHSTNLGLGWPDLGFDSTVSSGFDLGLSSMIYSISTADSDFNQLKKMRKF